MARGETRYQRIHRLIEEGQCGLLPLDLTCTCPRRNGPNAPHPDHPGKVGFLTCHGCEHHVGSYFKNRVCTHPRARQVAARWLAEAIRAWEEKHTPTTPARSEQEGEAPKRQTSLSPSSPDPPRQKGSTQLTMF